MSDENYFSESYISGTVKHVIFRKEENGYTVLKVKVKKAVPDCENSSVTVVGHFPVIESEERYTFSGVFKEHPRFGKQYQVQSYQKEIPTEREALVGYLASDRFPGIGQKTAEKMVDTFGNQVISHVLDNPESLGEIKGLNEKKRNDIYNAMLENQGMEKAMTTLTRYGFGMDLAVKIFHTYREQTLEVIQDRPYQLVWDIEGIGFYKADRLGRNIGISFNDPERVKAGILYVLYEKTMQEGHVYIPRFQLMEEANVLLSVEQELISKDALEESLLELMEDDKLVQEEDRVYMASLYFAEMGFSTKVKKLLKAKSEEDPFPESEFLKAIGKTEESFGIEYAEQQKIAIKKAIHSPLMILTGGPGTGKTTVIRAIVEIFLHLHGYSSDPSTYSKEEPFPILLAAPTGRAAKRMKESTGLYASTIHKLLGFTGEEDMESSDYKEEGRLQGKLLIIDEVSMLDMWLANQLFRAIPDDMQVVLVGDEDQLPSVGPGQLLGDMLQTPSIPVVALSVVYRQAEGSSIIELAHSIKRGALPGNIQQPQTDRRFFPCKKHQVQDVIAKVCEGAMNKGYTALDIQVLAPMYKGEAGVNALNERLQKLFNPLNDKKKRVQFGDVTYQKDDVILQLTNNTEEGVFNGDRGEVETIFEAKETIDKQMQIVLNFDSKEVIYTRQDLNQIMLAYCSSIHKAQGSEFPIVIVPMLMSYRRMLRRNLLYTAITRAKDYLIICGETEALQFAIENELKDIRYTRLKEKLSEDDDTAAINES
ncbi:ATP-dependent RecD-like DNA helicase [Alteribacillus sp. HJP-4]|uniref:SF1B family DNA helicase RecD2 n=1 Tax=Alteribacillus sp. HJP-4 TaxID=2775394 RepID=UPI0035CCD5D6